MRAHHGEMQAVACREIRKDFSDFPGDFYIGSRNREHGNDQVVEKLEGVLDCVSAINCCVPMQDLLVDLRARNVVFVGPAAQEIRNQFPVGMWRANQIHWDV